MTAVAIGLGSNVSPEMNLREAALFLSQKFPNIRFSSVYRTAPIGHADQADFLNAVALVKTTESPAAILGVLRHIERTMKKEVRFRFGPRSIDLDLLLYGTSSVNDEDLTVPHPRMHERRFVLEPLLELIDGTLIHPSLRKTWNELLEMNKTQGAEKVKLRLQ